MKNISRKDYRPAGAGRVATPAPNEAGLSKSQSCHTSAALVPRSSLLGISAAVLLVLCSGINVVVIEDFRVPATVNTCVAVIS